MAFEAGNADIVVINTCSVTNIADRKSRQMLHRARKLSPNAVIIAAGCYVQAVGENVVISGDADVAAGNDKKSAIIGMAVKALKDRKTVTDALESLAEDRKREELLSRKLENEHSTDTFPAENERECESGNERENERENEDSSIGCHERTRAFIKVTDGCNQFCAYCIIPYVRGRVRSRSIEDVTAEIEKLRDKGYKEIVLTGIHLSSYGVDAVIDGSPDPDKAVTYEKAVAGGFNGRPLLELIDVVSALEGIERIRLGSLEPRIITDEFIDRIKNNPKVCPHFHLSLQSGSDTVLKRMKRHYSTAEFEDACRIIRNAYETPSINTDIIVGFPGETEEEFEETLEFVEKIGFAKIHIFKYSRRKGTLADKMPGQIDESIKTERSSRLQQVDADNHRKYISGFIGKRVTILTEQEESVNGKTYMTGLTERYVKVGVTDENPGQNEFVSCLITGITENGMLIGE